MEKLRTALSPRGAIERFKTYNSKINWLLFLYVSVFTIGSWIDINGLWAELPIMVDELPESWRLPSILSATTQIGQIGPLIFLILHSLFPKKVTFVRTIYVVLGVGALSCLLLVFFWNKTAFIFDAERSIGIYILNFSLALLDGTSSVTFLPYIGSNYVKEYIIPNYIGESMAALVPSILSLIQNIGKEDVCYNVTIGNTTQLKPKPFKPVYSVSIYFLLMFILLSISTTSFSFLHFSALGKRERKRAKDLAAEAQEREKPAAHELGEAAGSQAALKSANSVYNDFVGVTNHRLEKIVLLTITWFTSFTCYGVLPGFQSYSVLPYGSQAFNLAVNLSFIFLPVFIFLSIWSYEVSVIRVSIEFTIAMLFSVYIIVIGALSPCPPMLDNGFGTFLIIFSWIITQGLFLRIRCLVAARLERFGRKILLVFGAFTMLGQFFGGIIVYVIIEIYKLLKDKPECVFDHSYCET